MSPPPLRFTLFPYTTLFRSYALLLERLAAKRGDTTKFFAFANTVAARSYSRHDEAHGWMGVKFQAERFVMARSEEHTSELQSRGHLVCRLLLEKKKITIIA